MKKTLIKNKDEENFILEFIEFVIATSKMDAYAYIINNHIIMLHEVNLDSKKKQNWAIYDSNDDIVDVKTNCRKRTYNYSIDEKLYEDIFQDIILGWSDDPCCGSGVMALGAAKVIREQGYDTMSQLWIQCINIDLLSVWMCFIQLSCYGVNAEVTHGNTLTQEEWIIYRTK